uniref:Uncharacterized protein n=1 Tax=Leersia perrieri TaxID=77586 RepID=A0A0D9VV79_9ORYZ
MLACAGYVLTMLADCAICFVVIATDSEGLEEGTLGSTNGNSSDPSTADATRHGSSSHHSVASMLQNASTVGDSVVFIATLCFYSVFEGIAIGVAGKNKIGLIEGKLF